MHHLILTHSFLRYLVLLSILLVIYLAWEALVFKKPYTRLHRIATASASGISQLQLLVGFALYFFGPTAQSFWQNKSMRWGDGLFFALVHFGLMSAAIAIISIGEALAKREVDERRKFRILFNYFVLALFIILVAIPWPFSPLAQRPWFRSF
jgi:predicted cation transporter